LKFSGEEHGTTLLAANNYATSLNGLQRFKEAKTLLRKTIPVARRVLAEGDDTMLRMRSIYTRALYCDKDASLDDLREAVATITETERTARRVLGGAHPLTLTLETILRNARAARDARETPPGSA